MNIEPSQLTELREYLNMGLDDLAAAAHIPVELIEKFEAGLTSPDALQLRRLARAYGVEVAYFEVRTAEARQAALVAIGRLAEDLCEADMEEALRFATYLQFAV